MNKLTSTSDENYLKTIYYLSKEQGTAVRSVDVASRLSVSKPSVNKAVEKLISRGWVQKEPHCPIHLTQEGKQQALIVIEKFELLTSFLSGILGLSEETARLEAGKLEHVISDETSSRLKACYGL
jgi:Mn-dependent DtxR family transcriptional regulator